MKPLKETNLGVVKLYFALKDIIIESRFNYYTSLVQLCSGKKPECASRLNLRDQQKLSLETEMSHHDHHQSLLPQWGMGPGK